MPVCKNVFTVTGFGPFPLDMLRYDSAWPADTIDADKIADTFEVKMAKTPPWEIKLYSADIASPTRARWASFNCKVL